MHLQIVALGHVTGCTQILAILPASLQVKEQNALLSCFVLIQLDALMPKEMHLCNFKFSLAHEDSMQSVEHAIAVRHCCVCPPLEPKLHIVACSDVSCKCSSVLRSPCKAAVHA